MLLIIEVIEKILMETGIFVPQDGKSGGINVPNNNSHLFQVDISGIHYSIVITRKSELIDGFIAAISQLKSSKTSHCILLACNYNTKGISAPSKRSGQLITRQIDTWFLDADQPPTCCKILLERLPAWINDQILRKSDNPEINPDMIIDLLQKLVTFASEHVTFGDNSIFNNVLSTETSQDDKLLKKIGAYLLINYQLFRRIISNFPCTNEYITKRAVNSATSSGRSVFESVIEVNDYLFDSRLTKTNESGIVLRSILDIIDCLKTEMIDQDLMGKVFHRLIPLNLRKNLAAYYTRALPASILAGLSITEPNCKVIDPACGSGTLLLEALKLKEQLAVNHLGTEYQPSIAEITGIDVMAFSTHLAALNLATHARSYFNNCIRIGVMDSTRVLHNTVIRENIYGNQWTVGRHDVVMMNPPFTKKQSLLVFGSDYREDLMERFQKDYNDLISHKSPLYQYFILVADRLLKKNGRIAAILPTTLLRAEDAEKLRKWLKEKYLIKYIIVRVDVPNFSEDTQFREMMFLADRAEAKSNTDNNDVNIVFIKKMDPCIIKMILNYDENQTPVDDELLKVKTIKQSNLCHLNFFKEIAFVSHELEAFWKKIRDKKCLVKLDPDRGSGRIKIRAKGTPTPSGMSFEKLSINSNNSLNNVLRSDRWIIEAVNSETSTLDIKHRKNGEILSVDSRFFVKHFRRCPYRDKMDINNLREFVVKNPDVKTLSRYLELSGVKSANWEKWNSFIDRGTSRLGFIDRIDVSAAGSCLLSWFSLKETAWGRIPASIGGLSVIEAKFLCLWFNSTFNFIQYLYIRNETRGAWIQLHKYIIEDILIPELSLACDFQKEIETLFDRVKDVRFPSIVKQFVMLSPGLSRYTEEKLLKLYPKFLDALNEGFTARNTIDAFFARILGISDDLDNIYPLILDELLILRKLLDKQ